MSAENTFEYNSAKYKDFLSSFRKRNEQESQLIVFAGPYKTNRKTALDELKREVYEETVEVDLSEHITPYEEESYQKLDQLFESIDATASIVIFRNAELLNGAYTAFSSSIVKYGTPQEKYFLKKLSELNTVKVVEFKNRDELDRMITRKADSVVFFKAPSSFLESFVWKIQNLHVHGSRFLSPRPH